MEQQMILNTLIKKKMPISQKVECQVGGVSLGDLVPNSVYVIVKKNLFDIWIMSITSEVMAASLFLQCIQNDEISHSVP